VKGVIGWIVVAFLSLSGVAEAASNPWSTRDYDMYPGDFNGDGLDDLLYVARKADRPSGIALSDGKAPTISHQTWLGNHLGITWYGNHYQPIVGDFDGDGRDDVFMQRQAPGDHYLILTDREQSRLLAISQALPNQLRGLALTADKHLVLAGDFDGNGQDDLLLQGADSTQRHAILLPDSTGLFTSKPQQVWSDGFLGFQWSARRAVLHIGDFDGDGRSDVFIQARPDYVTIAYDVPFDVPFWRPGAFAILLAKEPNGSGDIFRLASIHQTWDESYLDAAWSPLLSNVLTGDFNGDGRDDLLLQSRSRARDSFLLPSNIAGQFTSLQGLAASNIDWSAESVRLLPANFDGGSAVGLYLQSTSAGVDNLIVDIITGGAVSTTRHVMARLMQVTAQTAVGTSPGEFSVDESGAATYRMPLRVPPGVAGMTPELALVYNSRGGNGPLGLRWGLAGFSTIARCPATWVVDGFADAVDFDDNDRFCLDGQRLLTVAGATYGAVGAEYRTELQSFQKVVSSGGTAGDPASFTVYTKSGQILEYGTSTDSRVEAQGRTQALVWNVRRIRDRYDNFIEFVYEEDSSRSSARPLTIRYGNSAGTVVGVVSVSYETRPDISLGYLGGSVIGNDKRATRIDVYGRSTQGATGPAAAATLVTTYNLAYEVSPTTGQSHLESLTECDGAAAGEQKCLGSTDFVWQHGYRGYTGPVSTGLEIDQSKNMMPFDINNNGRTDYVFSNNGTWRYRLDSGSASTVNTNVTVRNGGDARPIDWDNDGFTDLIQKNSSTVEVIRGTATGLSTTLIATTVPAAALVSNTAVGDFNGDGRQDLVYPSGGVLSFGAILRLNTATGLSSSTTVPLVVPSGADSIRSVGKPKVVNFDGDGKDDLAWFFRDCYEVGDGQYSCGSPRLQIFRFDPVSGTLVSAGSTGAYDPRALTALDMNGDGLTDLVYFEAVGSKWQLLRATGSSTAPYSFAWSASSATYAQYTDLNWRYFDDGLDGAVFSSETTKTMSLSQSRLEEAEFYDYNRDGRTDIVMAVDGYWRALISTGSGYDTKLMNTERASMNGASALTVDANADGVTDIMYFGDGGDPKWRFNYGRGPAVTGVIETISDGLGATTQIQYGIATDANVYKGHTAMNDTGLLPVFPYAHLGAPIPVVAKFSADNGRSGGAVFTMYEYSGLKVHKQGRGLLGFSEVKSWNDNAAIQTINQYFQAWPYTGMLSLAMQRLPDQVKYESYLSGDAAPNLLLNYEDLCDTSPDSCTAIRPGSFTTSPGLIVSKTVNAFSQLSDSSGAVFPYVLRSEEYQYPLTQGTVQPAAWKYTKTEYLNAAGSTSTPSYDAYGNPHRIRITVNNGSGGDSHVVDTQNFYSNDAVGWILGRLLTAKVVHTRPTYTGSSNGAPVSLARVSSFTYAATGSLSSETTEPASYYDPSTGSMVANPNGTGSGLTKSYTRDAYGNVETETVSGAGALPARSTVTHYDAAGQLPMDVTNALGHQEQHSWDPRFGVQRTLVGPNGLATQWQYDSFGRVVMEIAPRGVVWSGTDYYWCALSAYCTDTRAIYVVRKTASDGGSTITEYDRLGREIRARKVLMDGREAYQDRYFDPLGREYLASGPYFAGDNRCYTLRRYDVLGRVISQWAAAVDAECSAGPWEHTGATPTGGQLTTFQYDEVAPGGAGIITTTSTAQSDAATRTVTRQTNVMGRLRFLRDIVSGGAVHVTEYDYDPAGNTSWVKDNAGNQTSIGFDVRGFKVSMSDPDMGTWTYAYDVLGQLTSQTDAKGQQTLLGYDLLGRMTSRVEKTNPTTTESTTNWYYDDTTVGGPKAKGKLTKVVVAAGGYAGATGYEEQYVYDPVYGDLIDAKRRVEGEWFWISQSYDSQGRLDILKYPNSVNASSETSAGADTDRLRIKHNYNAVGYLTSVTDVAAGTAYWTAVSNSAGGAILREDLGNGLSTVRTVDRASGLLEALTTGVGIGTTVQNLQFDWDKAGNLIERRDLQANKEEQFVYDGLYRLTQARLYATVGGATPSTTDNFTYDSVGNLTNKGGASGAHTFSNYNYGTRTGCANTVVRPHAVYQVTVGTATRRYCYDANGNLTHQTISAGSGTIQYDSATWWVANLAKRIAQGGGSVYSDFWYGAGRERIRQFAQKSASTSEATTYVGGLYEKFTRTVSGTPTTEHVHYVRGAGQAVAIVKRISGTLQTRYLHRDHLGSVVALTDAGGAVLERYSYDPWGKRRDAASWASPAPGTFSIDPAYSDRGYTGHEHIDHVGLINMNGRIYDPEIGRFLSADPTTQFPESTQGWNRYSYCGNNPLSYTDPSGFSFWKSLMKVVGIVMSVFAPQFTMVWQQMLWSFASGYLSSGGDLQGGLMAMAFVGLGRWSAGLNQAGAPAGTLGGTPGINPTGAFSFSPEVAAEVAGTAAERSMTEKIATVVYKSMRAFSPNDAGSRTNSFSRVNAQASDTESVTRLYKAEDRSSVAASARQFLNEHPEIAEGVGYVLIAVDIANTIVSPGPDVGIVGAGIIAGARVAKAARASAATRAAEIQGALGARTQRAVTTAVTETREGVRVVTSSEGRLRPAQRAVLQPGEVAGVGQRGVHAEVNGVNAARDMGLTPTGVAPSRPACPGCTQAMSDLGVPIIGP